MLQGRRNVWGHKDWSSPCFQDSVNPISTRGADYAHHSTTVLTMLKYVPAALGWKGTPKARSTLYIPALTLPFSSVFFDSFSITLLYSRRRGSWLWHSPVNTNTAIICVMGLSLNLTTPIKFSLTLINTDVHCILCKVYNRVDSSNITSQTWIFYFFRFFSQKTETEFWLLYIKIPKSDYLYKYALGNLKS